MAKVISLFNGKVVCKSYSELLAACGSNRRDSKYIERFGTPEKMVAALMPIYTSEEELVRALSCNVKRLRNTGLYSGSKMPNRTFQTPTLNREDEVLTFLKDALEYYLQTHPKAMADKDEAFKNDVEVLKTDAAMIKRFVSTIYRSTNKKPKVV